MSRIDSVLHDIEIALLPDGAGFDRALGDLLDHCEAAVGTLHRVGPSGELEMIASRGIPEPLLPKVSRIPIGKGMAGLAAERREPVQVCNLQTDTSGVAKPGARDTEMKGSISLPIVARDGSLLGTLGVGRAEEHEYSADEIAELERAARRFATHL